MAKWKILLITNRDSDNVGDQVIEISDIGLIHTIMKNLGIEKSDYSITSRAAGFITKKYLETDKLITLSLSRHRRESCHYLACL